MPTINDTISIENVVTTTKIEQELDLETLAEDLSGAEYDPDRFPGLIFRLDEPRGTVMLFRSGNVLCTGASTIAESETLVETVMEALDDLGIAVELCPDVEVQNIVSKADFGQPLNLNAIAVGLGFEAVEYEPEQFPGLMYGLDSPDVVVLIFGSGKVVVTGGEHPDDAESAVETVTKRLETLELLD